LFIEEIERQVPVTSWGQLEILRAMSGNGEALDFKVSLGLDKYSAIKAGETSEGKPIITTLRAIGNITFGANMHSTAPGILTDNFFYKLVMKMVGKYNLPAQLLVRCAVGYICIMGAVYTTIFMKNKICTIISTVVFFCC
jgi:hypothetical protein